MVEKINKKTKLGIASICLLAVLISFSIYSPATADGIPKCADQYGVMWEATIYQIDGAEWMVNGVPTSFSYWDKNGNNKQGPKEGWEILGTDGDDVIFGSLKSDRIKGFRGNDIICGGNTRDVISGGPGNDVIRGQHGPDVLIGQIGNDKIYGGRGNDHLLGNDGDDSLNGNRGTDYCDAGVNQINGTVTNCEKP